MIVIGSHRRTLLIKLLKSYSDERDLELWAINFAHYDNEGSKAEVAWLLLQACDREEIRSAFAERERQPRT